MTRLRLSDGQLHEPNSSDWDDVCNTVGPEKFFEALFHKVTGKSLPGPVITEEWEDDIQRILLGRRGDESVGAKIRQKECIETTDLPTYCTWETYGLPGMTINWEYALEYAGQLGHVAFRQGALVVEFENAEAEGLFSDVWKLVFERSPVFVPA